MVHVACHDLRSFHNFNLLTYFSFAYKSLYRCALWCFTSMYATLSLLHLKFDKLLMMRVRIASINSLCITIIKWTDDRFAAAQLLLQLQRPTDFQLMNEEIESLLLQLDNHSLVVTVIEVSHGATLVTVCLNKLHYNFCNHRDNRVILWYTKVSNVVCKNNKCWASKRWPHRTRFVRSNTTTCRDSRTLLAYEMLSSLTVSMTL